MMENAKERLSHILLPKKEKCIQNAMQQNGKKDQAMDQNSANDMNDPILDKSLNKCCFCTKVFLNSNFLTKHILRRHSENLAAIYRKLNDLNASHMKDQTDVISIILNEFSKLRKELEIIKCSVSDNKLKQNFYHNLSVNESNDSQVQERTANISGKVEVLSSELQTLRVASAKIETDVRDLKAQWNEYDIHSFCNCTSVRNTLIYQTLKDDLLSELHHFILENNKEQKLNINQLSLNFKANIERLEHLMKTNLEKIDISTLVQETMRSLEKEIEFFFTSHKAKKFKTNASESNLSEKISPKVKKLDAFPQSTRFQPPELTDFNFETINFGNSEKSLQLEKNLNALKIPASSKTSSTDCKLASPSAYKMKKLNPYSSELNQSEEINRKVKEVEPQNHEGIDFSAELEEKLAALNIPAGTKRLSNTDYIAKMKLVELERQVLSQKYQSFSDIYQCLNSSLDNNVSQKLKAGKKSRRIRFSLTPKRTRKKSKNNSEDSVAKFAEKLSDSQQCSSTESVSKTSSRNITPINFSDMELAACNSDNQLNSAASIKLISNSTEKRKLPSIPPFMSTVCKRDKRKSKKKYFQSKKQKLGRSLEAGLRGFLITCNNEPQCVKEAYNLLNEFSDTVLGNVKGEVDSSESSNDDDDIEDQLAKEIQTIKKEKQRFQQMSTKVKGIVFIQTTIEDPTSLVNAIFDDVLQTRQRRARYVLKFTPVIETCKASEEEIKKSVDNHLINFVSVDGNDALTYKIDPKVRHNSNITSSHILHYLRDIFEKRAPLWKVSMLNPDLVISVTILKSVCCISFLKNYTKYKKYNLSEVANATDKEKSSDFQPELTNDTKTESEPLVEEISSDLQSECTKVITDSKKENNAIDVTEEKISDSQQELNKETVKKHDNLE